MMHRDSALAVGEEAAPPPAKSVTRLAPFLLALLSGFAVVSVHAQLGIGWVEASYTKRIHLDDEVGLQTFSWTAYKSVCSNSVCADYTYDSSDDTETFRIFDSRSNRSEIRLYNEYSTGRRQFEGYVTFYAPLEDESLMQIFGSTSGATLTMTRGYAASGGSITVTSTGGGVTFGGRTILANCYGQEHRINVIHEQDNFVRWYVDGILKCEQRDTEVGVTNYWKYGCYGTTSGNVPAIVRWRAVRTFVDGTLPGAGITLAPDSITLAQGGSATSRVEVTGFTGNVMLSVSGWKPGVAAILNPTSIPAGGGVATLTLLTPPGGPTGVFPLTVHAYGGTNAAASLNLGIIPAGWKNQDIGGPGERGWASFAGGVFSANGGGNDIWGATDKFNFTCKTISGDTVLIARVDTQENTNPWAKSGLMMRETTNANSRYVGLYVTPGNGVSMQYRDTPGVGAVDHARHTGIASPQWLRLVRHANTFTGFRSADGAGWVQVGSVNFAMDSNELVGLAVTSHDDTVLCQSTFTSVAVPTPYPQFTNVARNGSNLVLSGTNGLADWSYYVLTTTNLTQPVASWTRAATNVFASDGSFVFTNDMTGSVRLFHRLLLAP